MNKLAIIDLGTNTCNLLIAEYYGKSYRILYQGKEVVKLGNGGIQKNELTTNGLERAIIAIHRHREKINKFSVSDVSIIATSAIRDAINKDWFQNELESVTGYQLQIISGEKEAELIFNGVQLAFSKIENHTLILDVGGGSNEFILTENGKPIWKQSFPLGMARVIGQFPLSEPITPEEIEQINQWFISGLEELWQRLENIQISQLIGCSGAFDTITDLIDQTDPGTKIRVSQQIESGDFDRIYQQLVDSTTAERTQMKGMESIRIEMIVPSVLFIKLIIDRLNIKTIFQTDYALREGVLFERIFS
jgi:exopolyphosphatase/guanosine-5'-triphosphate,3'-diphosphate pyrophosphatase